MTIAAIITSAICLSGMIFFVLAFKEKGGNKRKFIILISVGLILITSGIVYMSTQYDSWKNKFNSLLEYANITQQISDDDNSLYINRKVIFIDRENMKIDDLSLSSIPDDLKPDNPNEVGTVILVKKSVEGIGKYNNGSIVSSDVYDFTFIDIEKKVIIGKSQLVAVDNSPSVKAGTSGFHIEIEPRDVKIYLDSLKKINKDTTTINTQSGRYLNESFNDSEILKFFCFS